MEDITLIINGKKVMVKKGTTILNAAEKLNIDIPALCYDPDLEITGACRMCLVEIKGSKKLETSCSTKVWDGMVVNTESEKVVNARKEILQMLLDSHPNDCLTCQKAGECLLQEYSYRYDVAFRDHDGAMRPDLIDTSSPYILKDNSKCIVCGKCIITCAQVSDRAVLSFAERGYETRVIFSGDQSIEESTCVSCNRCVSVCPVGALIDKRELKKIRNWEGESKVVSCKACDYGCEFEVKSKKQVPLAVVAKPPTNGRPLCLKGRLTTELKYLDNPDLPYKKLEDKFEETTWAEALEITEIIEKINKMGNEK